ncbi:AbrB/MazE/SpoVT family DNA-binding domain-containing protein [Candidatus Saccharibacteria bacterium]|nr:MAG: AbrB/MazE/SpoVT family DNA-binding domain-containing protein [Candidatus Saccharibacteria bacterium]
MEPIVTVSSKRQITLPAKLSRDLNIRPGDKLKIVNRGNKIQLVPSTYDQELEELRKQAEAHMKRNGTWGAPWEVARAKADEAKLDEYRQKYGPRA